jgi:hypothetical protein
MPKYKKDYLIKFFIFKDLKKENFEIFGENRIIATKIFTFI